MRDLTISSGMSAKKQLPPRQSTIVPAGRMLTVSKLRAKDVPDMDRGARNKANISDPYLIFALLDAEGNKVDEGRMPHIENARNPRWKETIRLFFPDNDHSKSSKTPPLTMLITLMDRNRKKADERIGEVSCEIKAGSGKVKIEVPSVCVSSLRPFVFFHYEAMPQMHFEHDEWARVMGEDSSDESD